MEKSREEFPNKLLLFVTYLFSMTVLVILLSIVLMPILEIIQPKNENNEGIANALINFLVYSFLFVSFIFIMKNFYLEQLKHFKKHIVYFVALAFGAYFISIILNGTIMILLQEFGFEIRSSVNQDEIEEAVSSYWFLMLPMIVLFAPIVEETVFRGAIFNYFEEKKLPNKFNLILAFILSSITFGLIHVLPAALVNGDPSELVLGITYISTGLVLAAIYFITKNIFVSIFAHFIQNFISALLMIIQIFLEKISIL